MAASLERRWISWSLLMLVLAVPVCAWIGWNVYKVRERRFWMDVGALKFVVSNERHPSRRLPITWSLMGAQPIGRMKILYHKDPDDQQRWLSQLSSLFPEADISVGWAAGDYGGEVDDEDMDE